MKAKNSKIKPGRPTLNKEPLGKYNLVYEEIPEDGIHIRFNQLAKKLFPMSKQTISAALKFGCMIGIIKKESKSRKCVEYYKPVEKTYYPPEDVEPMLKQFAEKGFDNVQILQSILYNLRPEAQHDLLMTLRNNNDSKGLMYAQAIFLNEYLIFLEERILEMLINYADTYNKIKANDDFLNTIQFTIAPLIKSLQSYISNIGMDEKVRQALWLSKRRYLMKEDFDDSDIDFRTGKPTNVKASL